MLPFFLHSHPHLSGELAQMLTLEVKGRRETPQIINHRFGRDEDQLAQTLTLEVQGRRETSEIRNHRFGRDEEEKGIWGLGKGECVGQRGGEKKKADGRQYRHSPPMLKKNAIGPTGPHLCSNI